LGRQSIAVVASLGPGARGDLDVDEVLVDPDGRDEPSGYLCGVKSWSPTASVAVHSG
jgi:hypothetical protein